MAERRLATSPFILRDAELRRGFGLLHEVQVRLDGAMAPVLAAHGLEVAHGRALWVIGRSPGLMVMTVQAQLGSSKQTTLRVLKDLSALGLVSAQVGPSDRRQRLLRLTPAGAALENAVFDACKEVLKVGYAAGGPSAVAGFWEILGAMLPPPPT